MMPTSHTMNHSMHNSMNHSMHHSMNHSMHHSMHHTHPNGHNHHTTSMKHGSHGTNHGSSSGHAGMMMWFHFSNEVTVLFESWKIESPGELVGTMVALFIMGILYEGLKVGREVLKRRASQPLMIRETYELNGDACKKPPHNTIVVKSAREMLLSKLHLIQTLLHMAQVFLGYLLMLAFMTYNAWLCIAIILGAGSGYFLFGWNSIAVSNLGDHCF